MCCMPSMSPLHILAHPSECLRRLRLLRIYIFFLITQLQDLQDLHFYLLQSVRRRENSKSFSWHVFNNDYLISAIYLNNMYQNLLECMAQYARCMTSFLSISGGNNTYVNEAQTPYQSHYQDHSLYFKKRENSMLIIFSK